MSPFDGMWDSIAKIGYARRTGGYARFAWTDADLELREWFTAEAHARGLDLVVDRAGNQWAWTADAAARAGRSRLLTAALSPDRARSLIDADGISMDEAMSRAGLDSRHLGPDQEALGRNGTYVELHIEQGRDLIELDSAVAVGSGIWPHGRWRLDLTGEANHAGTTELGDRRDPMLAVAAAIIAAHDGAQRSGCFATVGKLRIEPNGVNAIPSLATVWLDARGPDPKLVAEVVADVARAAGTAATEESYTASPIRLTSTPSATTA